MPDGTVKTVEGTPFDFRAPRRIGDRLGAVEDPDHEEVREPFDVEEPRLQLRSISAGFTPLPATEPAVENVAVPRGTVSTTGAAGAVVVPSNDVAVPRAGAPGDRVGGAVVDRFRRMRARTRALFAGANHGSPHRLNDVWEFDLPSLTWAMLYAPDLPRGYADLGKDTSDVEFKDGVLELTIPMAAKPEPRRIEIQAA